MGEYKYARGRVPETIQFITEEMREFDRDYVQVSVKEYNQDRKIQKVIDRTVENIITGLIEMSGAILAERGISVNNYADVLSKIAAEYKMDDDAQAALSGLALQRNRLAHRYLDFRWEAIRVYKSTAETIVELLKRILSSM